MAEPTIIYSSGIEPDPHDVHDVLAFVLCPVSAFVERGASECTSAVMEVLGPAKAAAVRVWLEVDRQRGAN